MSDDRVGSRVDVVDEKPKPVRPKEKRKLISQQMRLHQKDIHILLDIDKKLGIISAWMRYFGIISVIGLVLYTFILLNVFF